jgi:hypothetical protein
MKNFGLGVKMEKTIDEGEKEKERRNEVALKGRKRKI